MPPIEWKIIGASVAGFSHQAEATPCQDFHTVSLLTNGWLVGAVSDGAGSAPRSAEGAKAICEGVVSQIATHISQFSDDKDACLEQTTVRSWVTDGVEFVRTKLTKIGTNDSIADFHATLVGVIAGPNGGLFFHIGDGAACATDTENFSSSILSFPENGEYANETFFFTQKNWHEHLRLTPFDQKFNLIVLMSDGVTPFALAHGMSGPHAPFFSPLSRYLVAHTREEGEAALAATLEKDAIRHITGDDKTLLWALRIESDG